MAKKYIFADSCYNLTNPPKDVTVLEFDTETNILGIYNNNKAAATIPVKVESDNDNKFDITNIPTKLSELQNDTNFITKKAILTTDYTAYQVFATDTEIPADSESQDLGGYVYKAIPANMTENVIIRSSSIKDKCDVIIDWGDNTTTSVIEMQTISQNAEEKDYEYKATHVYQSAGKYIVKIYGKNYYGVAHKEENLMCRVFDTDLPIASNFQNFTYFCGYATKLLNISIPQYVPYLTVRNWTACFKSCVNLRQASGFKRLTPYLIGCGNIFQGCENLVHTDFRLPIFGSISMAFRDCKSLADNIQDLEPLANFAKGQKQNIGFIFNNCSSLQGTITPSKWFEDKDVTWCGTRRAFTGCKNLTNFDSIPTFYNKNLADKGDAKSDQLWNS